MLGFWVPEFHLSIRKAQKFQPKFYFFDVGVCSALEGTLDAIPVPRTSTYGQYFESYVMTEVYRLNLYSQKDYRIAHYQTTSGGEINLVLSKGTKKIVIEIKSATSVDPQEVKSFARLALAFKAAKKYFVSQDPIASEIEDVSCLHFKDFLSEVFI